MRSEGVGANDNRTGALIRCVRVTCCTGNGESLTSLASKKAKASLAENRLLEKCQNGQAIKGMLVAGRIHELLSQEFVVTVVCGLNVSNQLSSTVVQTKCSQQS